MSRGGVLAVALLVSGCSVNSQTSGGWVDGPNGQKVWCVSTGYGVSCDWRGVRHEGENNEAR